MTDNCARSNPDARGPRLHAALQHEATAKTLASFAHFLHTVVVIFRSCSLSSELGKEAALTLVHNLTGLGPTVYQYFFDEQARRWHQTWGISAVMQVWRRLTTGI